MRNDKEIVKHIFPFARLLLIASAEEVGSFTFLADLFTFLAASFCKMRTATGKKIFLYSLLPDAVLFSQTYQK